MSRWLSGDLDSSIILEEGLKSGMKNKRTLGERTKRGSKNFQNTSEWKRREDADLIAERTVDQKWPQVSHIESEDSSAGEMHSGSPTQASSCSAQLL